MDKNDSVMVQDNDQSTLTMSRILAGYTQKWATETFTASYFSTCSLVVIISVNIYKLCNKSFSPFLSSVAQYLG